MFHTTDGSCGVEFPGVNIAIVVFDIKTFVSFPGPVGPGSTYTPGDGGTGDRRVKGEGGLTEWIFIGRPDNMFRKSLLFRVNV